MLKATVALKGLTLSLVMGIAATHAVAAQNNAKEPVSIELKAFKKTVDTKGKVKFVSAEATKPKDIIEYRATYTNNTAGSIKGLKATLPVPADTQYTGVSSPAGALASTDGVNFAATPLKKTVNGKIVEVPLKDYRALQWQVAELPSKKSVTVTAQTKVNAADD
ncbi:hypothetical protein CDG60_12890 [Acinetobacter chinensis]|jgi:hypothetical protein|uniref:DUF11 domain-containing protein n=1 Tax=Acinetobacter chinensis TaxID=2004650 RepID=A0A3B7LYA1_9GAMM|nr:MULTISPECIES: hypothetical protein [Acinetobacter]AXY57378.1 hypothetical protein CDG60_12890 [Acinetobacter chinensis]AXY60693.1 hypothetical protein CDG61_12085 [Acinetobacter sp. WCHAc010052]WOE40638.1 hypothetical protein QSG87_12175 [Acinetobacter chinensis]